MWNINIFRICLYHSQHVAARWRTGYAGIGSREIYPDPSIYIDNGIFRNKYIILGTLTGNAVGYVSYLSKRDALTRHGVIIDRFPIVG